MPGSPPSVSFTGCSECRWASTATFDFPDSVRVQVTYDLSHAREATEIRSGWREGKSCER
jgi:hypothetical protein